ncbi:MAG: response regulator [Deltaproteobacteria bacterium]|nr:response regulator [Deltaproteobacteria bacterium]
MFKNSIRTWLLIPLLCFFVLPLVLLAGFLSWQNYVVEKKQVKRLQQQMTSLAADNIFFFLHEQETIVRTLLKTNYLPDMTPDRQKLMLSKFFSSGRDSMHESIFTEMSLLDAEGKETIRISQKELITDSDLRDRSDLPEYRNVVQREDIFYSPVYFSSESGEPLIKMSFPIRDLETLALRNILTLEIKLQYMWQLVGRMQIGRRGIAYLTDLDGRVIVHPNRSLVLKNTYFAAPAQPSIMTGISGEKAVVASQKMAFGSQFINFVTEMPADEALRHINKSLFGIACFLFFIIFGALTLGVIVVRQIVKPIEDLAGTARAISKGDFSRRAASKRLDELEDLSLAFNTMTTKLMATINAVEEEKNFVRNVIESMTQPFYVIDAENYTIKLANSAASFGAFLPADTCYKLTHHADSPCRGAQHPCPIAEIKKTGKPVVVEHVHRQDNGREKIFEIYGYPIFGSNGQVSQVIEYNIDVTEKKSLEAQLLQAQKLETIGILTGGVAHDFNNLLTTIIGYSEIILMQVHEANPLYQKIKAIHDAGRRAAALTRQLLAFSRKQVMEMKVVNLNSLIANMLKMLGRLIGEHIEMESNLDKPVGNILADPGQVEQIIMNLAVNARDAMPDGGKLFFETYNVELDEKYCRTHAEIVPGSYVAFSVTDTGTGMTPEVKSHIFDPFFTTKERGKGTGLGLSTVYGIVKQMKGHIFVYSEVGCGTTFKIFFPEINEQCEAIEVKAVDALVGGTEKLLVVDDESSIRDLVRDTLEPLGYDVLLAGSGEQALELCKTLECKIDLLITDVIMPGMNGKKLAEALAGSHPETRVLFMSGYTDNIITHHGVLTPGCYFINKPLVPSMLTRKIREILDRKPS